MSSEQAFYPSLTTDEFDCSNVSLSELSCIATFDSNTDMYDIVLEFLTKAERYDLKYFEYDSYYLKSKKDLESTFKFKKYIPFDRNILIHFKNHEFIITQTKTGVPGSTRGSMIYYKIIQIKGKSSESIDDFIHWAIVYNEKKTTSKNDNDCINVYIYENGYWNHMTTQEKRDMDTIYLDTHMKENFIADVKYFLANKELYNKYGIQYKRSFLFLGPPGTGKSSLVYALASMLGYNVGIFKVSAEKRSLETAIKMIPKNTILLMEDIEHVFPTKDQHREHKGINESDILNCLNGVFYKTGLLIFMTSNDISKIPKKILRPGRVDYKLKFDFCTRDQIKAIYNAHVHDGNADAFCDKVKTIQLTPSILQNVFFKQHADSANLLGTCGKKRKRDIIDEIKELVEESKDDQAPSNLYQ